MTGETYDFPCARWFDRDEDDGQIIRELIVGHGASTLYRVSTITANIDNAGTNADVYIELVGELGTSGRQHLKSKGLLSTSFSKGTTDEFEISSPLLGVLQKCIIGHNGSGLGAVCL